jgi:hypothetical protein
MNPWLWVWGIPTPIYFPFYSYSLKKDERGCLEVVPTYNSYNGLILKMKYSYLLWAGVYAKLYLDSYQNQGTPGKGVEFNYKAQDKYEGRFYSYYTDDKVTNRDGFRIFQTRQGASTLSDQTAEHDYRINH